MGNPTSDGGGAEVVVPPEDNRVAVERYGSHFSIPEVRIGWFGEHQPRDVVLPVLRTWTANASAARFSRSKQNDLQWK